MPLSRSGRRTASDWNTSASISIPSPASSHAITAPTTPLASAKLRGSVNTPPPTIEPTTIAASVSIATFGTADVAPFDGEVVFEVIAA